MLDLSASRRASTTLVMLDDDTVNAVLNALSEAIPQKTDAILEANASDRARMDADDPKYDRLKLTTERLQGIADAMRDIARLPSPLNIILEERQLDSGLHLQKKSVPIGVIGMIYEARPNVTFDAFALTFKSGNACVLKGGSDAADSNTAIVQVIKDVLREHKIDEHAIHLLPADRSAVEDLLNARDAVDLIIPRGSQGLINFVRDNANVPVIETGAGIVHTYIDASADADKAMRIVHNAKVRRPSVCNALDCIVIHEGKLSELPHIMSMIDEEGTVEVYADDRSHEVLKGSYNTALLHKATPESFGTEFLSLKMSITTVSSFEEALTHIEKYSSKHSEAIVAEDEAVIEEYLQRVDAAAVYSNASTYFTDGAQFGLGAEIGISTQKLHARGPMGLREMTSYKWVLRGNGTTRE